MVNPEESTLGLYYNTSIESASIDVSGIWLWEFADGKKWWVVSTLQDRISISKSTSGAIGV